MAVEAARGIDRETYTYSIPGGLEVVPGHRVMVPFGRRSAYGFVVAVHADNPGIEVREIERVDVQPLLLPHQVELARIVSIHYWAPLIECLRAMLPPRVRAARTGGAGASPRQRRFSHLLAYTRPAVPPDPGPHLNAGQEQALEIIRASRQTLLHGVTASGKTEVYLHAADEALSAGFKVLVLVPEISLTPQFVALFASRLGVEMSVLHSQLTELERAQQWWKARRGDSQLVIGSRSAVFAPTSRLGLICLDEEGSSAYKQDRTPRYETGWVARRLAEVTGARLVLGSATPTVASYHEAQTGRLALAELPRRVVGHDAEIELVDMREEALAGNRRPLSRRLLQIVDSGLANREQTILFLNRRGAATFVLCRECGKAVQCPGCSVAMVEHSELGGLACHYCGYTRALPELCPYCGSRQIRGLGLGTQRLEGMVRKLWPQARVLRLDSDSAKGPDGYFDILETFAKGQADILVGTQMVAKGLDLEGVTSVAVIDADLPLHFPDYRSAENTFALVTQVAGRAGRRGRPAHVVVQTSNPDHYSLRRAAEHDYRSFYGEELPSRALFRFPPFAELAVMTYSDEDADRAATVSREAAEALASALVRDHLEGIRLMGPSPAFIHRLRGDYRWQITLKGDDLGRARLLQPRGRGWSIDVDPVM